MGLWRPNRRGDDITPITVLPHTTGFDTRYRIGKPSTPEGVAFEENNDGVFSYQRFISGRNPLSINMECSGLIYIKASGRLAFGTQLRDGPVDLQRACLQKNYLYHVRGSIHDRIAAADFRMRWWIGLRSSILAIAGSEWDTGTDTPKTLARDSSKTTDKAALNIKVLQYFGGEDEGHAVNEHVLTQGREIDDDKEIAFGVEFINQTSSTKVMTDMIANFYIYRYDEPLEYHDFGGG